MPHPGKPTAIPGMPVPTPYPYADAPAFPAAIGAGPAGMPLARVHGAQRLRRLGPVRRRRPAGAATPNACAGQGYCATAADHTCHVQNDCRDQGGCGLYGTGEEMDHAG